MDQKSETALEGVSEGVFCHFDGDFLLVGRFLSEMLDSDQQVNLSVPALAGVLKWEGLLHFCFANRANEHFALWLAAPAGRFPWFLDLGF